jgi:HSP20 family protein
MAIMRYDPTKGIFAWPRWLDEFDDQFLTQTSQRGLRIHETEKSIVVDAVVAGVPSGQVEVNIEDGVLTIKAESKSEEKTEAGFESSAYRYYYTAALSGGDWHKSVADIKNGVVTVTIPKAEAARPKKITVKAKKD